MHRARRSLLAVLLVAASACTGSAKPSSEIPFAARSWPETGTVACETDATGAPRPGIAKIEVVDELTVRFTLCAPDPAFTQKLAVANFAVNDSG